MSLHCADKVSGVHERFVSACIKPGKALSQKLHIQFIILKIDAVQVSYLKLASCRGLEIPGILNYFIVIEIQSSYTVIGLGMFWLFLYGHRLAVLIKFNYAETLRVIDIVAEDRSSGFLGSSALKLILESVTCKYIVAKYHGNPVISDKILAYDEGLREPVRRGLHLIA